MKMKYHTVFYKVSQVILRTTRPNIDCTCFDAFSLLLSYIDLKFNNSCIFDNLMTKLSFLFVVGVDTFGKVLSSSCLGFSLKQDVSDNGKNNPYYTSGSIRVILIRVQLIKE